VSRSISRTVCRRILRGVPENQRIAVGIIACDSEWFFRLDPGVFPADEQVETNEVGNSRRRNVKQEF